MSAQGIENGTKVRLKELYRPEGSWGLPTRIGEIVDYDADSKFYDIFLPSWHTSIRRGRSEFTVPNRKAKR